MSSFVLFLYFTLSCLDDFSIVFVRKAHVWCIQYMFLPFSSCINSLNWMKKKVLFLQQKPNIRFKKIIQTWISSVNWLSWVVLAWLLLRCITNVHWNFLITVLSYFLKICNYVLCWSLCLSLFKILFKVLCMLIYCDFNSLLHNLYQQDKE